MATPPQGRRRRRSAYTRSGAYRPGGRLRRRVLVAVAIAAGFAVAGASGALAYFLPAIRTGLSTTGQAAGNGAATSAGPVAPHGTVNTKTDPFTVLLMGSDNDSKFTSDHLLTQSMILVRVVPQTKHVTFLSIPRDLYVPLASGGSDKIMSAYFNGGASNAVATVERNLQVHVDHYVWIGLRGLIALIDEVGGVDVVTTNPVLDDFYPSDLSTADPNGYQRVAVMPGAQHMTGAQAMEYVRSRHSDLRGDFGRSDRQQQVLLALRAKAKSLSVADLPQAVSSLSGELLTDMTIPELGDLLPLAGGLSLDAVQRILLLPPYTAAGKIGDAEVLLPDWDLIRPLVAKSFPP